MKATWMMTVLALCAACGGSAEDAVGVVQIDDIHRNG